MNELKKTKEKMIQEQPVSELEMKYKKEREICNNSACKKCSSCFISQKESIHSRRCFMTGEYCSRQRNIQQKREKLRKKRKVMAFVAMNFSEMSEVVYNWRVASMVETLSKFLYIEKETNTLHCCASEYEVRKKKDDDRYELVESIQVMRADSAPSSNYVVCDNICQQLQVADIVVVDVSYQNPNVFYEFGMAVALGKLILPICYNESYYKRKMSKALKADKNFVSDLEHHIGCYPWRKVLFEHFGLQYKNIRSEVKYKKFERVIKKEYKFDDAKYTNFPYREDEVGKKIYKKLQKVYNDATPDDNTLVVYTMERYLNEEQAGQVIVNFYRNITLKMRQEGCFSGERVGVLGQSNSILENDKDKNKQFLFYNVGEIIRIGLNQATYYAAERKIKTKDVLNLDVFKDRYYEDVEIHKRRKDNIIRVVKEYIRNRGLLVYPQNPIYVNRLKNGFYGDILEKPQGKEYCYYEEYFCLYHIMLKTLCYVNELVVDISNNKDNCIHEMFWLGAAHGKDVYVITVSHEEHRGETAVSQKSSEQAKRNIFDVAGLWKAILHADDTDGFYKQLMLAQRGVENHSKLIIQDADYYEQRLKEYGSMNDKGTFTEKIQELYVEKEQEEKRTLESYYRNKFWKTMLRYNQLHIYMPQRDELDANDEPRVIMIRWDLDAVSELSNYLSKRMPIGEYRIASVKKTGQDHTEEILSPDSNFISVGESAHPLKVKMVDSIYEIIKDMEDTTIHECVDRFGSSSDESQSSCGYRSYKGFRNKKDESKGYYTQHPKISCIGKDCTTDKDTIEVFFSKEACMGDKCSLQNTNRHTELAQIILWREDTLINDEPHSQFRVCLIGSSGPATMGASMLFVDDEQKKKCMSEWNQTDETIKDGKTTEDKEKHLLSELQQVVRETFMERYIHLLEQEMDVVFKEVNMMEKDIAQYKLLVKCAVQSYLSTVLYRYFLPFLSERDILCIRNGMFAFLDYMKVAGESPFALSYIDEVKEQEKEEIRERVREKLITEAEEIVYRTYLDVVPDWVVNHIIQYITNSLFDMLKSFKGLEVFYKVKVSNGSDVRIDARELLDIEILKEEKMIDQNTSISEKQVHCFFAMDKKTKKIGPPK